MGSVAVLFDAENVAADCVPVVLRSLGAGRVASARAVGDFAEGRLCSWVTQAKRYGLTLVLQPSLGKGKNSADIMLTVEAMDIAYRGQAQTIALVSNDRDFTPLVLRLRAMGLDVLGFSAGPGSDAFRAACTSFTSLARAEAAAPALADPAGVRPKTPSIPKPIRAPAPVRVPPPALSPLDRQAIGNALAAVVNPQTSEVDVGQLGSELARTNRALLNRLSGGKGLRRRLADLGMVEETEGDPRRVRLKPSLRLAG